MNNYHFYEEIGKGKHSMVYRCRKKKCVEFCAIKSVDKVSRQKVLNEVMVLNSLHHHNVLKFHTWYETRNHIWLIMEYCTGGDLLNVLLQDTKLPESAIADFGFDLMDGLQFIHSKSVVCCDLKPSNILLDENGTLKFSDFGLSQLLGDIGKGTSEQAQSKRGTPCYMAPELFRDDGYHSFASDFWALGCVLYEMAAGRPPFVSTSFRDLMDQILNHDFPPIPGSTPEFIDLLQALLCKDRFDRMTWPQLLACPLWDNGDRGAPEPMLLPSQPRFDADLQAMRRQDDEAAMVAAQLESRKRGRGGGGGVDVLRLSRAANSNLAKEVAQAQEEGAEEHGEEDGSADGYAAAAAAAADASASSPEAAATGTGEDVELAGPDVELNFSAPAEDAAAATAAAAASSGAVGEGEGERTSEMARVESAVVEGDSEVTAESVAAAAAEEEEEEDEEIEIEEEETMGPIRVVDTSRPLPVVEPARPAAMRPVTAPETSSAQAQAPPPVNAAPTKQQPQPQPAVARPATTATSTRAEQEDKNLKNLGAGSLSPSAVVGASQQQQQAPPLEKLIYHGSDAGVKPIVNNKRIERIIDPKYDTNALPFQARTLHEMLQLAEHDQPELEKFLTSIFRSVGGPVPVAKKVNTLAYFETLCTDTNAANILINSSLMSLFVKMSKAFKSPTLKVRLATAMGLLIRHATYITEQLSEAGLVDVLTTMVQDKHENVRRRSCATLGELLFYVATQSKDAASAGAGGQGQGALWTVPGNVFGVLVRCLRDVDDVVQHYAAKAVENMATAASAEYFTRLARSETVTELLGVFNSSSHDGLRSTAISAISRLAKRSPSLTAPLMEKHGVRWIVDAMAESNPKIQQSALTILLQALHEPSSRLMKSVEGERGLSQAFIKLSEHAVAAIRGKALLCTLSCSRKIGLKWLARACEAKLLPSIERVLARDADNYARQCASCVANGLLELVPTVLDQQAQLLAKGGGGTGSGQGGQRPGSSSRPGSRGRPGTGSAAAASNFTVLHHLTTSAHFLARLGTTAVLTQLGEFLRAVQSLGPTDKFKSELLLVVEAFTQHPPTLIREWKAVLTSVCPALASLMHAHDGDTRFFALQKFSDIMLVYINDPTLYAPVGAPPPVYGIDAVPSPNATLATSTLDALIRESFFPKAAGLLVDEDPIPLYALKLLSTTMERSPLLATEASSDRVGLLPLAVDFLRLDHPNNNIHNLRLIEALVQCGTVAMQDQLQGKAQSGCIPALYSLGLVDALVAVLDYAHANQVDSFFESVLGIILCLLSLTMDGKHTNNVAFAESMECFLALLGHADGGIAELSAACIVALVKQYSAAASALAQPDAISALSQALGGAEEPTQSFVLDLGLRVVRLGGGAAPVDTAEMRDLIGVALRLSDPMRGGGGGDPTVTKLAQQLLAEAGAA